MPLRTFKPPMRGELHITKAHTQGCSEEGLRIEIGGDRFCDLPQDASLIVVHDAITDDIAAIFGLSGDGLSRRDAAVFVLAARLAVACENLLAYMRAHGFTESDPGGSLYLLMNEVRGLLNDMEAGRA